MKKFFATLVVLLACVFCVAFAACGNQNKVTISLVYGDNEVTEKQLEEGEQFELPEAERDGYVFEGWFADSSFTGSAVTEVTASENATYYAKWSQLFTVTLDAKGGSLASSSFTLKEGASLYEALANYTPTKADYKFDAWLNGTTEVTANTKMPSANVTLEARYKVKYTIVVYKENLAGTEFVKDEEDVVDYGYVGATLSPELPADVIKGFSIDEEHEGSELELTLSETASDNVFTYYLTRNSYTVNFYANYPEADSDGEPVGTVTKRYGDPVTLPSDLFTDGYCLVGWGFTTDGEAAYEVDSMTGNVFNEEQEKVISTFEPDRDMSLYGVWSKGYSELFGGGDSIYITDEESGVAYLNRDGVFFKGTYNAETGMAVFAGEYDEPHTECKILPDGTFAYYIGALINAEYYLYDVTLQGSGASASLYSNTKLTFDGYNGLRYQIDSDINEGTFTVDDDGYLHATFTEGTLAGQTAIFMLTTARVSSGEVYNAFRVRDEAEYEAGTVYRGVVVNGQLTYYTSQYSVVFTGFHTAALMQNGSATTCLSFVDGDMFTLVSVSSSGSTSVLFTGKFVDINDEHCYLIYNEAYDLTATSGSETLELDGCGKAVYSYAGGSVNGYYSTSSTGFGDSLVTMIVDGREYANFIVTAKTFVKKSAGYRELNYARLNPETGNVNIYNATYLVLNDNGEGTASIYCSPAQERKVTKVSTGTWELVNGLYVYKKTTWDSAIVTEEELSVPFPAEFSEFVFTTSSMSTMAAGTFNVSVWVKYKQTESAADTPLYTEYNPIAGQSGKLALLDNGNVAIYTVTSGGEETNIAGSYRRTSSTGLLTLTVASNSALYFIINETDKTFELLDYAPYTLDALDPEWVVDDSSYLSFTGRLAKVGDEEFYVCTYNTVTGQDANGRDIVNTVKGKVKMDTVHGENVFTSDDNTITFKYKMLTNTRTGAKYYSRYNEKAAGRYLSEYNVLELDGYGTSAELDGRECTYIVDENNFVTLLYSDGYVYLDIKEVGGEKTFTLRDEAYGTYILFNNRHLNGYYLRFDGYGKLEVFTRELNTQKNQYEDKFIDEDGSYTLDGDRVFISYSNGTVDVVDREGRFDVIQIDSTPYNVFCFTYMDEFYGKYVSESDWSVIELNGYGMAVKHTAEGAVEVGMYEIITEELFYYINDDGTDAAIYRYDDVALTATPISLRARAYYTTDMNVLNFTRYGFAIINGTDDTYYYDIVDNHIIIYEYVEEGGDGVSKYGFRTRDLGEFGTEKIVYEGEEYLFNDGSAITFTRIESDKNNYRAPVSVEGEGGEKTIEKQPIESLIFSPRGGEDSYQASGRATIGGTNYSCTINRLTNEDGTSDYYMYISSSSLRFKLALTYGGVDAEGNSLSTFTIVGLDDMSPIFYAQTYLLNALFGQLFGISVSNTYGMLQINTEYDADSESTGKTYLTAAFGSSSGMYDLEGNIISLNRVPVEYDETTSRYTLSFTAPDDCEYEMAFSLGSFMGMNAYAMEYVTRKQVLTSGNYTLTVNTVIYSDLYNRGSIYSMSLMDGDKITFDRGLNRDGGVYYVSRTKGDDGKITATEYYAINLKRNALGDNASDEDKQVYSRIVPEFDETTLEITKLENVKTYYDESGKSYVDIDETAQKVLALFVYDEEKEAVIVYTVTECTLAEGVYTAKVSDTLSYTVKIIKGKAKLTEVPTTGGEESEGDDDETKAAS